MEMARPGWPNSEAHRAERGGFLEKGMFPSPPARGSGGAL